MSLRELHALSSAGLILGVTALGLPPLQAANPSAISTRQLVSACAAPCSKLGHTTLPSIPPIAGRQSFRDFQGHMAALLREIRARGAPPRADQDIAAQVGSGWRLVGGWWLVGGWVVGVVVVGRRMSSATASAGKACADVSRGNDRLGFDAVGARSPISPSLSHPCARAAQLYRVMEASEAEAAARRAEPGWLPVRLPGGKDSGRGRLGVGDHGRAPACPPPRLPTAPTALLLTRTRPGCASAPPSLRRGLCRRSASFSWR
jgi:hypothetical protein